MEKDLMYYFDKKSPYQRHELGEIQTGFNMSLTIDGTKDSMQVQVYNFDEKEITPNTILYHKGTGTWWIVKRDIVKRYANEKNYYYTHNLTISGAVDLLSVRDLCDCGFNDRTYTIDQFIKRLFSLSTFEFSLTINYGNNIDENKIVDYIKSFENYSPLSALRELLNGYNCDVKLTFNTTTSDNKTYINGAILNIIPRTGNVDLTIIDISEFDDIRESKTINKESYGTTVISNAQNVNSTLAKTYPQVGGTSLTGDSYNTSAPNLYFKTPTPIFNVNWLKAMCKVRFGYGYESNISYFNDIQSFFPQQRAAFEYFFNKIIQKLRTEYYIEDITDEEKEQIYKMCLGTSQITFYSNGFNYNPKTNDIIKKQETPYLPLMKYGNSIDEMRAMLLADKETRNGIKEASMRSLYFERGGDKIQGFGIFFNTGNLDHATDTYYPSRTDLKLFGFNSNGFHLRGQPEGFKLWVGIGRTNNDIINRINRYSTMWQINYVPMSDIKIKYDNSRNDKDTHIYNQNGKLNDSVALSKLIDSYAKEIQSDNITRYMHYTDFNDIPQVGTIVDNNGEKYVINNISYDFYVNEESEENEIPYYIECEFTMSKYMSVKSLMVNPNSNIRDYGIPQKYNVKRRQTYRDYFEFSLTQDSDANQDTPYVALDNYIIIGTNVEQHNYDHTAIIKIDYKDEINGSGSWYYQLSSTAYVMNKSIYELVDFNDNNIIGYDMQTAWSGFNMSDLYDSTMRNIITPVSYVDNNGRFVGITMQMVNAYNLSELYDNILRDNEDYDTQSLASHVFVGETFYYGKYETRTTYSSESDNWFTNTQGTGTLTYNFQKPNNYIDNTANVSNIVMLDRADNQMSGTTCNVDSITETDNSIIITFSYSTGTNLDYGTLQFRVNYSYLHQIYAGAIELKDYEIKELNYNKDAIEVPVFEYILQLGDTEQVEVGERILDTSSGLLQMYTCDVRNANTTTQLNASKVFSGLEISGDVLTGDDNYDRQVAIADTSAVDISFENNNTIMRVKVYASQEALFYGNSDNEFAYQSTQVSSTQLPKSYLKGKDIVIYKNVINSMTYDPNEDEATCDYDNELMFIIHNPQDSNFDGDDLLVRVNYYKLK